MDWALGKDGKGMDKGVLHASSHAGLNLGNMSVWNVSNDIDGLTSVVYMV